MPYKNPKSKREWTQKNRARINARVSIRNKRRRISDPAYAEKSRRQCREFRAKNPQAHRDRVAKWRADNPKMLQEQHLRTCYGITCADRKAIFKAQEGRCALCGKKGILPIGKKSAFRKILVIDHDHKTGRIRGLIHGRCNRALGLLGDDIPGVLRALNYLHYARIK